jgi:hypothetical protein
MTAFIEPDDEDVLNYGMLEALREGHDDFERASSGFIAFNCCRCGAKGPASFDVSSSAARSMPAM